MNPREIVQALLDSVQRGDFQKAKFLVSNDCQFSGPVLEPIKREAWLGMNRNLKKAFPNLDYHFHVDRVDGLDGGTVKISAELKGTHSGVLDLSALGLGVTPATNKSFATPHEHGRVTIKYDKVASWVVEPIEGGGVMGILGQLTTVQPCSHFEICSCLESCPASGSLGLPPPSVGAYPALMRRAFLRFPTLDDLAFSPKWRRQILPSRWMWLGSIYCTMRI
jgi:hypothetical protein